MTQAPSPDRAEDIGQRVLALVENVRGPDDIAPERIEALTGIPVRFNPDDASEYGFSGSLTEAWDYNFVSLPDAPGRTPSRAMFSFDDRTGGNADMAPIAALDFDGYAARLRAAGFRATPAYGPRQRVAHWDFARGAVSVQVYVRGVNDADAGHACVAKLIINA